MANTELENILTQSVKNRNRLIKRLHFWQERGNDSKCDEIYSQLWAENSNIEYCQQHLEAQE